jgi:hypothetical protein
MWFRRKNRNRKNERESVLEVKMRSRAARAARLRVVTAAVAIVGGTALGLLVIWHAYQIALQQLVYRNDAYAIRRLELRHQGRLRPEQLRRWAGVVPGQNLLALDLDRIQRDLELVPWIERAEVEAQRPDLLRISVWEREPVAQVVVWRFNFADRRAWPETNLVDATGFVMPPLRPDWIRPGVAADFAHLTRLSGLDTGDVVPGQRLSHPRIPAALELIQSYEDSTMYSLVDLDTLDVSPAAVLLGTLRRGPQLVFATNGFPRQMRRWRSIHDLAGQVGRELAWLDLSVTNNLPARWVESTNAPSNPPAVRPQRNRRRHV